MKQKMFNTKFFSKTLTAICILSVTTASAQVQSDKPVELTGGTGERAVKNLELPVNGTDAANKDYVDAAVSGGGSFTFSITPGRSSISYLEMNGYSDTTVIEVKRLTGTTGVVTLSASGFPSGIAWDFYSGGGYVSYQSTLKMERVSTITPGTYTITVTGTGGGSTVSDTFDLVVTDVKRVFITSTTYTGNIGGLAAADNICQTRANAGSLGGTWQAWLSTNSTSVSSRFAHFNGPYVDVDGNMIANDWNDLTDGMIIQRIGVTELHTSPPSTYSGYAAVWSNTRGDGTSHTGDCSSWGGTSGSSYAGVSTAGTGINEWTNWTGVTCNTPMSLYCFEQ